MPDIPESSFTRTPLTSIPLTDDQSREIREASDSGSPLLVLGYLQTRFTPNHLPGRLQLVIWETRLPETVAALKKAKIINPTPRKKKTPIPPVTR